MAATSAGLVAIVPLFQQTILGIDGWPLFTPQHGLVLAVLLRSRRGRWAWIVAGYLIAMPVILTQKGLPPSMRFVETLAGLAEVLLAAFTLPPFRNLRQWLLDPRLLRSFAGYALLLGPGIMCVTVAQRLPGSAGGVGDFHAGYWQRAWIAGFAEAIGIGLVTPLVLVLSSRETYRLLRGKALPGTLGLLSLLALTTWIAFADGAYPLIFLPYAVLLAIVFRKGIRGAVLGTAVAAAIVTALSTPGGNPHLVVSSIMTSGGAAGRQMLAQSYLALTILTTLPLGVVLAKRQEMAFQMEHLQAELDRLKALDRLTGVSNRKRFDLVLAREWQRATRDPKPISLLMIDVDYFDLYNGHYGNQAGDECLRLVAAKMADQPHRPYDLVSRYDGGRFSILLPGAPESAALNIAEEVRAQVAAMELPHQASVFDRVTVSVGLACLMPFAATKPETLIEAAEAALARAKTNGRNRVEALSADIAAPYPAVV